MLFLYLHFLICFIVKFFIALCLLLLSLLQISSAQKSEATEPYSSIYKLSPITRFEEMPSFDKTIMLREDRENKIHGIKTNRFAKMFNVAFHPFNSGTWDETDAGKVWRLGLRSSDAYSLYLVFGEFKLVPGVKLFVYNVDYSDIAGAFTNNNNNSFNKLTVSPVSGDLIIVELNIPSGTGDFGNLMLSKVGHDYHNLFGYSRLKSASAQSDTCEIDVNCDIGQPWQREKRAVCRMIVNGEYCTGTLINNAENLKIPYLLAAYHCVSTAQIAAEGLFYFNLERTTCGGGSTKPYITLSGSELVSTTDHKLDFALLKLYDYPPLSAQPYFVGWDASTSSEPQSGTVIHHPNGDVKKISITNHPLITGSFGENYDPSSHWVVSRYDYGATEGGSSGAPIFNPQHRLVGTLTGGSASCSYPKEDYFAKFSLDWNKYQDSTNQVKRWLNPANKNITFINGIDPFNDTLGICNTFWNIGQKEYISLNNNGLKWGYLSSNNASGVTQVAEKFINNNVIRISGVYLNVAKAVYTNPFATIKLKIWEGDYYPTAEIYSKSLYIKDFIAEKINYVGLDKVITAAGNFFIGYEVDYNTSDQLFAVYQSADRGTVGPSTMYVFSNETWKGVDEVSSPAVYSSLSIGFIGCDGEVSTPSPVTIKISPNPFSDNAQIQLPEGVTIDQALAIDYVGRQVSLKFEINYNVLTLYAGYLADGIYILELKTRSKPLFIRFSIIRK